MKKIFTKSDKSVIKFLNMKITEINIYPVKSLKGLSLKSGVVEERGFENDRRLMIVDKKGDLVTQREVGGLATVLTRYVEGTLELCLDEQDWIPISDVFDKDRKIRVRVWNSHCEALLADDALNSQISQRFGKELRLVWMPSSTRRRINEAFNRGDEIVSFADGYPFLIIGEKSLEDLNSKLEQAIPMNRFRPNLVFSGAEAFVEDKWKRIKIGETVFRITKPCARCTVTTVDQKTGISAVREPLRTFATYRKSSHVYPERFKELGLRKNDVLFGQNLVAENFGEEIKLGDEVEVIQSD